MMHNPKQAGFSLVEALVAITILLIVIVGPMTISSQSAQSTSFASEQVVAFFLAQEGAELFQKHRDDYFNRTFTSSSSAAYTSTPWQDFKNSAQYGECLDTGDGNGCGIEITRTNTGVIDTRACGSDPCALYFDDRVSSDFRSRYTHTATTYTQPTPYQREVVVNEISADEIRVVSTVYWRSGNIRDEQTVSVETYLFNTYGQ